MSVRSFSNIPSLLPRRPVHRSFLLGLAFIGLSACADDTPPEQFTAPDFSYLTPLHLDVASITVDDRSAPAPDSLSAKAPTAPDAALKTLAQQRLVGTGPSGQGQFIIKQAYLQRASDDAVDGAMDVQLNVADSSGQHTGYVHARVTRHYTSTNQSATSRASLDALTKQMAQDMNVELEYQIRHRLGSWMTDAQGNPLTGSIQQQNLSAPGSAPSVTPSATAPATTGATTSSLSAPAGNQAVKSAQTTVQSTTSAVPDAIFPTGQSAAAAATKSPQPNVLKLPSAETTQSSE
ncbi:hypothetical protein D5366_03270 [Neokomagataea tanensis]|uniref:Lipoprotein n=1 Tax=Neokomagataea tanensis TaxID=661191 RepID=A0A4Y6V715_9PROT|nr:MULTISPECIES: hypothetical protein [Neokomagataea]QDH24421.1 hypothetical protein D5366_03270 [Neokomagataea tanensis]